MLAVGEGRLLLPTDEFLLTDPVEGQGFWFCDENVQVLLTLRHWDAATFCRGVSVGYH